MRLAVVGDVHGHWSHDDVAFFNASDYDAILLTGDLPRLSRHRAAYALAGSLAALTKPAWLVPGNHDGTTLAQVVADILRVGHLGLLPGLRQHWRVERLRRRLGPVVLAGYSTHVLGGPDDDLALLVARPHSQGGGLNFGPYLKRRFEVGSLGDSAAHLKRLIDGLPQRRLVVLAHNGPAGLGDAPTDIWGCDFKRGRHDWGDADLRDALEHARATGKHVLAVVAGHMHLVTKQRHDRVWRVEDGGTTYVNAACVPRRRRRDGRLERHHVALELDATGCRAERVWV
jgi:uncharacterized protein (TIGR04168 family)